eukprot:COSAG06_NODE_1213_length_10240_cov_645.253525_11_plen_320_part_00
MDRTRIIYTSTIYIYSGTRHFENMLICTFVYYSNDNDGGNLFVIYCWRHNVTTYIYYGLLNSSSELVYRCALPHLLLLFCCVSVASSSSAAASVSSPSPSPSPAHLFLFLLVFFLYWLHAASSISALSRVSHRFSERFRLCFNFPAAAAAVCAGTVATSDGGSMQSAVCAEHPMAEGAHYVEMTLLEKGSYGAMMGVVGQGFDAAGGGEASDSAEGWLLSTGHGTLWHAGPGSNWQGQPQLGEIKQGDVVGLLLDLGQRTLSVYLNGARRGVMVAPGMKNDDGEAVASLAGPLRWAVTVGGGGSVRIERKPPPPSPAAD